jgi:phosphoribosylformylglycinamidine cyclo-ligase
VRLTKKLKKLTGLRAFAHITGGGMDNIPRVLPEGFGAELSVWPLPELFQEAQRRGQIPPADLYRTFNCGVGFVAVVAPELEESAVKIIQEFGYEALSIGRVIPMQGDRWGWKVGAEP